MIIYGIMDCEDCREALAALDAKGVSYEFRALGEKVQWLKDFLKLRDHSALYDEVRAGDYIGIPTFLLADGRVTLDLAEALAEG